jgi:hypothetical protein
MNVVGHFVKQLLSSHALGGAFAGSGTPHLHWLWLWFWLRLWLWLWQCLEAPHMSVEVPRHLSIRHLVAAQLLVTHLHPLQLKPCPDSASPSDVTLLFPDPGSSNNTYG